MALLDDLLGGVLRNALGGSGPAGSGKGALIQALLAMLLQGGLGGARQPGGSGMGDLGSVLGGLLGGAGGPQAGSGGLGGALSGGLGNLGQIFEQAGLGDQVKSWVSTGQNKPISPDEITHALGRDRLGQLAEASGMSQKDAADQLSQILPQLVDGMTPRGSLPREDEVSQEDLGQLVSRVLAGDR